MNSQIKLNIEKIINDLKSNRNKLMKYIRTNLQLVKKIKLGILKHKIIHNKPMSQIDILDSLISHKDAPIYEEKDKDDLGELEYSFTDNNISNITRNESNKWSDGIEKDDKGDYKEDVDEEPPQNNTTIENTKINSFDEELFKKLESKIESLNDKIDKLTIRSKDTPKEIKKSKEPKESIQIEYQKNTNIIDKKNNTNNNLTQSNSTNLKDDDLVDNDNSIMKMLFKQKDLDVQIYNLSEDIYRNFLIK